ncbi:tumor necrosis factor receptor superfamily member 14-like [Centroberyx affinis]|uniref:tumor necrosis factor receptor superfamily member 14-like n=1 Tax=Centroberyx affinis TaxID=166261 RepID=UPI003A5C51FF
MYHEACHVLTFLVLGAIVIFAVPGMCCGYAEYETADGECCPMCQAGSVVRKPCTSDSSTACGICGSGSYMDTPNGLPSCFTCRSCNPGKGLFTQQECTRTTNTVCGVLDGYFCTIYSHYSGCSFAEKHSHCAPGQRIKALGTKTTNTECEDCQSGYCFSDDKDEEGRPSIDVCGNASRHHYYTILPVSISLVFIFVLVIKGCLDFWQTSSKLLSEEVESLSSASFELS